MLLAAFLAFLIIGLVYYFESPLVKQLEQMPSVEERIRIRKKIKPRRWLVTLTALTVVIVGLCIWYNHKEPRWYDNMENIRPLIMLAVVTFMNLFRSTPGEGQFTTKSMLNDPVSTTVVSDVLNDKRPVALYLRHFRIDEYDRHKDSNDGGNRFNEKGFVSCASRYHKVYAVSRPKELTSPEGAERVNLDNTTWKQDIRDMMAKASVIYIVVDDSQNCIWEIEETKDILHKTVFIVDNLQKYQAVRQKLAGTLSLPQVPSGAGMFYFIFTQGNQLFIDRCRSDKDSYNALLENAQKIIIEQSPAKVRRQAVHTEDNKSISAHDKSHVSRKPQSVILRKRIPGYLRILTWTAALLLLGSISLLILTLYCFSTFDQTDFLHAPAYKEILVLLFVLFGLSQMYRRKIWAVFSVMAIIVMAIIYFVNYDPTQVTAVACTVLALTFVLCLLFFRRENGANDVIASETGSGWLFLLLTVLSGALLFLL